MRVVYTPATENMEPTIRFYNVWFVVDKRTAWLDPTSYESVAGALRDAEEDNYKRIAVVELVDNK